MSPRQSATTPVAACRCASTARKRSSSLVARDPGDTDDLATLAREEPGCELVAGSASQLCRCSAPANEPGHVVEAVVYTVQVAGAITARAEIAELHWIDPSAPDVPVARLSREHILPML